MSKIESVEIQQQINNLTVKEAIDGMAAVGGILETFFGAIISTTYPEAIPLTMLAAVITGSSSTMMFIRMRDQGSLHTQLEQFTVNQVGN
ncbi:MAG: hypothetical protein Q7R49_02010 [Candidatus Daviesbacteria bacterium]|nr:hypothetical protein [Candidatus Daviesbacteria bacterium]